MKHAQVLLAVAALAASLIVVPGSFAQAGPPGPDARPLEPGAEVAGNLATPAERDIYQLDVPASFSVVQILVTHANTRCEVWATLSDLDGTVLGRAFVIGRQPNTVTGLVPAAGPVFLSIDDGRLVDCAGAAYRLTATVAEIPQAAIAPTTATPAPPAGRAAQGTAASVRCYCWSSRAEQLSTKIRRTIRVRNQASGAHRRRLTRKLAALRVEYRAARRNSTRACTSSA